MRLSKLYTNQPIFFNPILFNDKLNVVLAEIRIPENRAKDTHNLEKSTVRDLINFCLLSKIDNKQTHFLISNECFSNFEFFLEIKLLDNTYLTVRRAVNKSSKACFKKHSDKHSDFSTLSKNEWDHYELGFDKSKELLDSLLDLSTILPYSFRKILGYLIRSQEDYTDTFDLSNFRGKHSDWKPILAKVLGLNEKLVAECYEYEEELVALKLEENALLKSSQQTNYDSGEIEGILALKLIDLATKQSELESLDFSTVDQETSNELINKIGKDIQDTNNEIYYTKANISRINETISEAKIKFSIIEAEKLFKEASIVFSDQIKKDYQQLLKFHADIISERKKYLIEERNELETYLQNLIEELKKLNDERSKHLGKLNSLNVLDKYKALAENVAQIKISIETLQQQSQALHQVKEVRSKIRNTTKELENKRAELLGDIDQNVAATSSTLFADIRYYFSQIIDNVLAQPAMLNVALNSDHHLEFTTKLLDASGNKTSADRGNSYKKLLCIAFDLALLKAYVDEKFPHFVFHDGVFDGLDDRKSENLLIIMRELADLGIQQVITLIDSDAPKAVETAREWFADDEIVCILHDEGNDGLLFKMSPW